MPSADTTVPMPPTSHADLLRRHRAALPSWVALYYAEPIALVDGSGRRVTDAEGRTLPRLLRRHPHHHDGLQRARGRRRRPAAGRPDAAHVDAVPDRGRRSSWPSRSRRCRRSPTPRCSSAPGHRGTETALLLATAYRRSNQVLALRNSYHGRGPSRDGRHRQPGLVAASSSRRSRCTTCTAATASAARSPTSPTASSSPPAPPTCARSSTP